jgi:hypothetical protein
MQPKDYLALFLSIAALLVSLYNLYAQQFRRRDRLIGAALTFATNCGTFDRRVEYFLSNVGDTQIVLKEVSLFADGRVVDIETSSNFPSVMKPGEVLLVDILYKAEQTGDQKQLNVEFGLVSNRGVAYRLPHLWKENSRRRNDVFATFRLSRTHEGF